MLKLLLAMVVSGASFAALTAPALSQSAESYPAGPVQIVVPFPPGGGVDTVARLLADRLQQQWGQPVVIETKPGGGGNIAASDVARAAADGSKLLFTPTGVLVLGPLLFDDLTFDPMEDLQPVSIAVELPQILVVPANSEFTDFEQLLAHARENPGDLTVGSSGRGTGQHLAVELMKHMLEIDLLHIPYGGSAPATTGLLSSEIDMLFVDPSAMQYINGGQVLPLAVTTPERVDILPDVPSLAEFAEGYEAASYYELLAPAGTPQEILDKINAGVNAALEDETFAARLTGDGMYPLTFGVDEATEFTREQSDKWKEFIATSGIELQ